MGEGMLSVSEEKQAHQRWSTMNKEVGWRDSGNKVIWDIMGHSKDFGMDLSIYSEQDDVSEGNETWSDFRCSIPDLSSISKPLLTL